MLYSLRKRTLFASVLGLALGCSEDDPPRFDANGGAACAGRGERCTGADDAEGELACEDGEPTCRCDEDPDEGDAPPGDRDAALRGDGRAPRGDAGAELDAGSEDEGNGDDASDDEADAAPSAPGDGPAPRIPDKPDSCPEIKTGMVSVLGQQVQLWVGEKQPGKRGPILFYWHGTGSTAAEAQRGLGAGNQEILDEGGVIASFTTTTRTGQNTGNNVWYTGDFEMADQILACAIEQQDVDPRRVYTAGCSAGGLQASAMAYARSSYLAGAMPNSGGTIFPYRLEDVEHVPAVIATHGAAGRDVVVGVDFSETTTRLLEDLASKGGFAVQCDHMGGHCLSPSAVKDAQWEFLKAHPFGVSPQPYAGGLPSSFPEFCKVVE